MDICEKLIKLKAGLKRIREESESHAHAILLADILLDELDVLIGELLHDQASVATLDRVLEGLSTYKGKDVEVNSAKMVEVPKL